MYQFISKVLRAAWTRVCPKLGRDARLSIEETLCPDVIQLILDKLPCVERYNVYSLLCTELKKILELRPKRLCLHWDFNGCVTCEEEGFGSFQVGLCPIIWRHPGIRWVELRWVEWSSSKGLVAYIAAKTPSPIVSLFNGKGNLTIVIMNIVTGSTKSIKMPCLEKIVNIEGGNNYINMVFDHDPQSKIYKVIIIEGNSLTGRCGTFHIYSSETGEWQKYKKMIEEPFMIWHALRSGFLLFSTCRCAFSYRLHVLDITSMASIPISDTIYNVLFITENNFRIEILWPVLCSDDNIVAFGSEVLFGNSLTLWRWEYGTGQWLRVSCVAPEKLVEFVSHYPGPDSLNYGLAATFQWKRKVGVVLKRNPNYGLTYDMELDYWECIFHPGLQYFKNATPAIGLRERAPNEGNTYLPVSFSLVDLNSNKST